jgi:hypothetical protein
MGETKTVLLHPSSGRRHVALHPAAVRRSSITRRKSLQCPATANLLGAGDRIAAPPLNLRLNLHCRHFCRVAANSRFGPTDIGAARLLRRPR